MHDLLSALREKTGHMLTESQKVVPKGMTFRAWCEKLGREGMKVDGQPFRLDDRPAMAWIYDQIPSTEDEAYRLVLVLMKCAQVGFTVMEILATIYLGLRFSPITVGMFLPDIRLANIKSTNRFMPIVRSVPSVHSLMVQDDAKGGGRKQGEGNVGVRMIGDAMFVFSWTSGKAATESVPMGILSFDEVQEMTLDQMEKAVERLSASPVRFTLMGSTANWPDADIHWWFKRGSQHEFHTECPTCLKRKPLDDYFPDCIKWDTDQKIWRYVCEAGHWIDDPQRGDWVAKNPDADPPIDFSLPKRQRPQRIRSVHFPQMLSPTISAGEIIDAYNTASDPKNFHNRKRGKPYLDPSQVPVTMEHLARCVEAGKTAIPGGVRWKTRAPATFMGIDQMGQFNVHIIKERLPDGRQATVHVEETYAADPFMRSSELMEAYGVQCCVVEINPNFNDAHRFAMRHPGKVFLCNGFGELDGDMVRWGDAPKLDVSERRTDDEGRTRYTVKADQFKVMQVALGRFTSDPPRCVFPDPDELIQDVREKGMILPNQPVLRRAFLHFTKTALVVERVPDAAGKESTTNRFRRKVKKIALDPHFSYANQLCEVAWSRAHGTATFILPEAGNVQTDQREKAESMDMPGLPNHVVGMLNDLPVGVCGRCSAYPFGGNDGPPVEGHCSERNFTVAAKDPACPFYAGRES